MARVSFVLMIVLAVATTGYSSANVEVDADDTRITSFNETKPANYRGMENVLATKVDKIKNFTRVQEYEESDVPVINGDEDNCWSETTVRKVYTVKTKKGSYYVAQTGTFKQLFKWTVCHNNEPKKTCFGTIFESDTSIETQCGEKYTSVSLYIYDLEIERLKYKMFEVPVACVCKFKNVFK